MVPDHELLRVIGEGSYGRIWLAINAMGTYRAVKVVNRSRFKEDRPYEREYEGIKNFEPLSRTHEGFVDILQVERNDEAGYFYYVMELADDAVRGQAIDPDTYVAATLSRKTAEHGRIPLKDCLAIGITLAGTLDFLHKNKLVHRDIKSENIVLINGRPKLADIGLVTDIRSDSTYVGTPGFIPPEGPGAPAADIYSLGKVLYEISTGLDRKEFPRTPDNSLVDEPDDAFPEWNAIVRKASEGDPNAPPPVEVIASSSDQNTASHTRLAELVVERAKRLTELGKDTLVLLDSLTRLARAYNKTSGSGRTMSGGVDSKALEVPKRLFGAARAFDEGGTLTILGTALIETGSRMDEVIFQEFKGTGNMELVLNRGLAERRVYPAIDLGASGTRKEERLLPAEMLEQVTLVRRSLMKMKPIEAMEAMVKQLSKTKSNAEFLGMVSKFVR